MCWQEEEQLFQFHMANLENACGASLKHVSAFYWDHNEAFAQFGGPLCVVPRGLAMLMEQLAKDIDIRLNKKVHLMLLHSLCIKFVVNSFICALWFQCWRYAKPLDNTKLIITTLTVYTYNLWTQCVFMWHADETSVLQGTILFCASYSTDMLSYVKIINDVDCCHHHHHRHF